MIHYGDHKRNALQLKDYILSIDPAACVTLGQAETAIHIAFFM